MKADTRGRSSPAFREEVTKENRLGSRELPAGGLYNHRRPTQEPTRASPLSSSSDGLGNLHPSLGKTCLWTGRGSKPGATKSSRAHWPSCFTGKSFCS